MKTYERLADAFVQEDVKDCFALLGDANMHWGGAMADRGVHMVFTRHEHAALAAAAAYSRATGRVGCASVTCGPGLTQLMTILPIAARARLPLIVFAGEPPIRKAWYNQAIDHVPFVEACGARYHSLHDPAEMLAGIRDAFVEAKRDRIPIVIGIPFDLQNDIWEGRDLPPPSNEIYPSPEPLQLNPSDIETAVTWLVAAQRPIVLAGLGAVAAGAGEACRALAEKTGALLATTLPARGLFYDQDYCLGIAGGFASEKARAIFAEADLVIGVGTRLAAHAFDGGKLTPNARVIQIDIDPHERMQGRKAADLLVASDAKRGVEALTQAAAAKSAWRNDETRIACSAALDIPDDHETPDGLLHPMATIKALDAALPKDWHIINTSGHCSYFAAQMNRRPQDRFTVIREFGAIGNGTSYALGLATAFPDRPIVLIDGDGSALMHVQELETMKRMAMNVLIVVMNDGAYGSEVHKLRADGVSEVGSVFGRPDFGAIAKGFGLTGHRISTLENIPQLVAEFKQTKGSVIWDMQISDQIASPQIHRAHKAVHS